jgi:hypothetical protein
MRVRHVERVANVLKQVPFNRPFGSFRSQRECSEGEQIIVIIYYCICPTSDCPEPGRTSQAKFTSLGKDGFLKAILCNEPY